MKSALLLKISRAAIHVAGALLIGSIAIAIAAKLPELVSSAAARLLGASDGGP